MNEDRIKGYASEIHAILESLPADLPQHIVELAAQLQQGADEILAIIDEDATGVHPPEGGSAQPGQNSFATRPPVTDAYDRTHTNVRGVR